MIEKLASPNQSTFLEGKMFLNGLVFVNEVINLSKRSKKASLIFKVDFKKVCDSVS